MCSTQCFMQPLHRHAAVTRLRYGKQQRFQRPVKCGKANVTVGGAEAAAADSDLRRAFTALRAHCGGGVRDAVRAGTRLRIRLAGLGGAHAGKTGGSAHGDALQGHGEGEGVARRRPPHCSGRCPTMFRISRASKPIPPMHGPIRTRLRNTSSPIRTATTKTPCSSPSPSGATRRRHRGSTRSLRVISRGSSLANGVVKVNGDVTGNYEVKTAESDDTQATAVWRNDTVVFSVTGTKNSVVSVYQLFPL